MADDETAPTEMQAWIRECRERESKEQLQKEQAQADAEKAKLADFSSILADVRPGGPFRQGADPRRHDRSKPGRAKKSFAQAVRDRTDNNAKSIDFLISLADGLIPGSNIKERLEAHKELLNRGQGKAPETVINVDGEDNPLADVSTEDLMEAVQAKAKKQ